MVAGKRGALRQISAEERNHVVAFKMLVSGYNDSGLE
jgi:hypothetical protein